MLKGDLASTPLPAILRQLADGVASGCLHVNDGVSEEAKVYLRGGQVYAVQVPGRRPQLGARLVSSGSLGPEALAEALEAQRTELQGWRLGELLVHLGYVDQPVVEAFINEQVREQTSDLSHWRTGTWKFRVNERTREDVAPPTSVEDLLHEVAQRQARWETITEVLHGPDAVPMLSSAGQSDAEMAIDPEAWSLLCKVDGHRSLEELAVECGFTLFEAGQVVYTLVRSGLLEVEEVVIGPEVTAPSGSVASRLAAAFAPSTPAEPSPEVPAEPAAAGALAIPTQAEEVSPASLISAALREDRTAAALASHSEAEVVGSLDRISQALAALLGPTTDEHLFDAPKPRTAKAPVLTPAEEERAAKKAVKTARDAKRRELDSAELAAAQAELEATKAAHAEEAAAALTPGHEAEIVSLADVRRGRDEDEAEAARVAAAVAAEVAAAAAAEAEAAQLAAHEAEQARLAAEAEAAEAARLAEEQAAAEAEAAAAAAAAAEAERLAVEQAEQAERAAAEAELRQASAEQAAAEAAAAALAKAAAETAAESAEADRLAEEQQAADAEYDEQVRLTAQRADAGNAFAELSAAAASASDVQVLAVENEAGEDVEEVEPAYRASDTDMASLFRELSSLGMEDAPEPPPTRSPGSTPRPVTAAAPAKKKKGLFGR